MASKRRIQSREARWNRYLDKILGRGVITFADAEARGFKIPPGYHLGPRRRRIRRHRDTTTEEAA